MVIAKFEHKYESLKSKFSLILFAYNLDTLKRIKKIIRESAFDSKKKKPGLKFNLRLALTGVRTTGPWYRIYSINRPGLSCSKRG